MWYAVQVQVQLHHHQLLHRVAMLLLLVHSSWAAS
jgi:hypothetical protein